MNHYEPFTLVFPKQAQRLDYHSLNEEEKRVLGSGIAFDPQRFSAYRLSFLVKMSTGIKGSKRTRRRRSYERANRLIINLMVPAINVQLVGIYPQAEPDPPGSRGEGQVSAGLSTPLFSFNLSGLMKDLARRRNQRILAGHTDGEAQWVFLKPYLQEHTDFNLTFLLALPADLDEKARFIWCQAAAFDKGRLLHSRRRRKIPLGA